MGIEYFACRRCEAGFHDAGCYESCDCGRVWCSNFCAESDGLRALLESNYEEISCKYCREEDFEDSELLDFILKREGIRRVDVIQLYLKESE